MTLLKGKDVTNEETMKKLLKDFEKASIVTYRVLSQRLHALLGDEYYHDGLRYVLYSKSLENICHNLITNPILHILFVFTQF